MGKKDTGPRDFRARLAEVLAADFGGTQRKLAQAYGRVAEGHPRDVASENDSSYATAFSPYVNRWLRGRRPYAEQLALLCRATGRSADWWLFGEDVPAGAVPPLPAARGKTALSDRLEKAVVEGLFETLPLQQHLTFEYRGLVVVALKLAAAVGAPSTARHYRAAGRLVGRCLEAPVRLLGARFDNPWDQQLAQAYVSAAAHAVEILAPHARPAPKARRKGRGTHKKGRVTS